MDDQIRHLLTNLITFDQALRLVEISQAYMITLGVPQYHSAIDDNNAGITIPKLCFSLSRAYSEPNDGFCIAVKVI